MVEQNNFKEEWEKAKVKLGEISHEATLLAKKGEEEFRKISHQAKLYMDATTLELKKEHLYFLIGKEYVQLKDPSLVSQKLKTLTEEYKKIDQEQKRLKTRLKIKNKK